jgi:hypothetical protein
MEMDEVRRLPAVGGPDVDDLEAERAGAGVEDGQGSLPSVR